MEMEDKAIQKIMDIIKVQGFIITSKGDPDGGMEDIEWVLNNNLYFDNKQELEAFRTSLANVFEEYCGKVEVLTFEEQAEKVFNRMTEKKAS